MGYRDSSLTYHDPKAYDEREKTSTEKYLHQVWRPVLLGYLEKIVTPETVIADLGAGSLTYTAYMKKARRIYAVEISPVMIAGGREKIRSFTGRVTVLQEDATATSIGNKSCDIVWSIGLSEYINDVDGLFQEMWRILKPGGRVYLQFPNRHSLYNLTILSALKVSGRPAKKFRSWGQISRIAREAGFRVVSMQSRGMFGYLPEPLAKYFTWLWRFFDWIYLPFQRFWPLGVNVFCVLEKPD